MKRYHFTNAEFKTFVEKNPNIQAYISSAYDENQNACQKDVNYFVRSCAKNNDFVTAPLKTYPPILTLFFAVIFSDITNSVSMMIACTATAVGCCLPFIIKAAKNEREREVPRQKSLATKSLLKKSELLAQFNQEKQELLNQLPMVEHQEFIHKNGLHLKASKLR